MMWQKMGMIYNPSGKHGWDNNTVITPTPVIYNGDTIRIYAGFRDDLGRSRIGYIDVDIKNPSRIIKVSDHPVLDLGNPGMFDDNGLILGDVICTDDEVRMYYVGFQLVNNVKFLAYSGLAVSRDQGENFERVQQTPIMDRSPNALFIRAIHTVIQENDIYRIWYSVGNGWESINGRLYPQYDIRYTESKDGINFDDDLGISCVTNASNEYRIGRPRVRKLDDGRFEMRFTSDTYQKEYRSGIAYSDDGVNWIRSDEKPDLNISAEGWDSEMVCYPVILKTNYGTYMFYSGNGMGASGVGYAVLAE
jgi:predicted GH43/DUF377 family glycosyl hydrolase